MHAIAVSLQWDGGHLSHEGLVAAAQKAASYVDDRYGRHLQLLDIQAVVVDEDRQYVQLVVKTDAPADIREAITRWLKAEFWNAGRHLEPVSGVDERGFLSRLRDSFRYSFLGGVICTVFEWACLLVVLTTFLVAFLLRVLARCFWRKEQLERASQYTIQKWGWDPFMFVAVCVFAAPLVVIMVYGVIELFG